MSKIELGKKFDDMIKVIGPDSNDTHYPTLHLDGDSRLGDLPDTGECRIKYKIRHKTHEETKEKDGKKHTCSVTMDVTCIYPPEGKKKKSGNGYGDDARKSMKDYFEDK